MSTRLDNLLNRLQADRANKKAIRCGECSMILDRPQYELRPVNSSEIKRIVSQGVSLACVPDRKNFYFCSEAHLRRWIKDDFDLIAHDCEFYSCSDVTRRLPEDVYKEAVELIAEKYIERNAQYKGIIEDIKKELLS